MTAHEGSKDPLENTSSSLFPQGTVDIKKDSENNWKNTGDKIHPRPLKTPFVSQKMPAHISLKTREVLTALQ